MAGSLIKIDEEIVTSAVASVTLGGSDWDSSYDVYMVKMNNVTPNTDANYQMRVLASDVVQTTANYDKAMKVLRIDTAFSNSSNTNQTSNTVNGGSNIGTGTGEQFNGIQYLYNFNNSNEYSFFTNETSFLNGNTQFFGTQGGGVYTVQESHNGVNYFFSSGDIEAGTFTLYGLAK